MRVRLRKSKQWAANFEKEVKLTVRGENGQRLVIGFYNGAEKKISSTNYAAVDVDFEERRVYFVETNSEEGWKFTGSKNAKELSMTVCDGRVWKTYEGRYNLLKDNASGNYFIDLVCREEK